MQTISYLSFIEIKQFICRESRHERENSVSAKVSGKDYQYFSYFIIIAICIVQHMENE